MAKKEKKEKKEKKVEEVEVLLKLKRPHKTGFRLGRHLISLGAAKYYSLNEKEQKEFKTVGPQHWLKEVTEAQMLAAPKSNKENKEIQDLKKYFVEKDYELAGDETLEQLLEGKVNIEMHEAVMAQLDQKQVEYDADAPLEDLEALLEEED